MSGDRMLAPAELLANLFDAAIKKGKKYHLTLSEANMKEIRESLNTNLERAMKEAEALNVLEDAIIHTNNMGQGFEINGEKAVLVPHDELRTVMDRVPSPGSQNQPVTARLTELLAGLHIYGFDLDPETAWDGRTIPPRWLAYIPITEDADKGMGIGSKQQQIDAAMAAIEMMRKGEEP